MRRGGNNYCGRDRCRGRGFCRGGRGRSVPEHRHLTPKKESTGQEVKLKSSQSWSAKKLSPQPLQRVRADSDMEDTLTMMTFITNGNVT